MQAGRALIGPEPSSGLPGRKESGEIRVYFDDMKTPAMTATDKTFGAGRVGFGSFDDTGNFDDIRIYTP